MSRHISRQEVQIALRKAILNGLYANYIPGRMGKPTATATWTFDVPGGRGWKYVQLVLANGESGSITQALNTAGVADTGDLAIWLNLSVEGKMEIVGLRFEGT